MPNPLAMGAPPPAPQDGQAPQQNALQQGGAPQGAPMAAPAPTHAQTVAALRHFHALQTELEGLMKDPDIGKASIKDAIITGATKLVAAQIITPAQAVAQLGNVPENPREQKQWVEQQYMTTIQAERAIVAHRQAAVASGAARGDDMGTEINPESHMQTMGGLHDHYKGLSRG